MASDRPPRLLAFLALAALVLARPGIWAAAPATTTFDVGLHVQRLCQRINGIVQGVLDLEKGILFRLEKKRPVDWERMASRFASARRQVGALRRMALRLEERIPASHPALAKIQSLKSQLRGAIRLHLENVAKIVKAGGEPCRQAMEQVREALESTEPASATVPFPVQSLDDQF